VHGGEESSLIDLKRPENIITGKIIDKAIYIHKKLGPGLLEHVYEESLRYFLQKDGLKVETQKAIDVYIDEHKIPVGFRADMIVEDQVICEIKSVEKIVPIHNAQLMTYLRLSGIKVGLLMNFNTQLLKDGLKRIIL